MTIPSSIVIRSRITFPHLAGQHPNKRSFWILPNDLADRLCRCYVRIEEVTTGTSVAENDMPSDNLRVKQVILAVRFSTVSYYVGAFN